MLFPLLGGYCAYRWSTSSHARSFLPYFCWVFVFSLMFAGFNNAALGQTTIWSEDFSNSNDLDFVGTGIPNNITGWNTEGYTGKKDKKGIYVLNKQLIATDNVKDDKNLWEIDLGNEIDISGYGNVSVSIDFSSSSGMKAGSEIQAEYSLDKGLTWISFSGSPISGDIFGTQTLSVSNLSGTSLTFHFSMISDKKDLYYYADNIIVQGELPTLVPDCTTLIGPLDGEADVELNSKFSWNETAIANGYKFYLGADNPPANIINDSILFNNYLNYSEELEPNTTYYWKVVPYNIVGDADGCPIWSFTTGTTVQVDTTIQIPFNEGEPLYFNFPFEGCEIVTGGILHISVQGDIKDNKKSDKFYSIVDENLNSEQFGPVDSEDKCAFATNIYSVNISDLQSFAANDTISYVAVPESTVKDLKDCNDYVSMHIHYSYIIESPCLISGQSTVSTNETSIVYTGPEDVESYSWSITGDAVINGTTDGQTIKVDASGNFQVHLLIDEAYPSCSSSCMYDVLVIDSNPTITTTGSLDTVCYSSTAQTGILQYTSSSGNPIEYSIDWNDAANGVGFVDQGVTAFAFENGGGDITGILIPEDIAAGTYNGTMTIITASNSVATQVVSITINGVPDIFANFTTSASDVCDGNPSLITITSDKLETTDYEVTYDLSGTNSQNGLVANMSFNSATNSGTFYTIDLANPGDQSIKIKKIKEISTYCSSEVAGVSASHSDDFIVYPNDKDLAVIPLADFCQSGETGTTKITWSVEITGGSGSYTFDYTIKNEDDDSVEGPFNVSTNGNTTVVYTNSANTVIDDQTYTLSITNVTDFCGNNESVITNNSDTVTLFGVPATSEIITN